MFSCFCWNCWFSIAYRIMAKFLCMEFKAPSPATVLDVLPQPTFWPLPQRICQTHHILLCLQTFTNLVLSAIPDGTPWFILQSSLHWLFCEPFPEPTTTPTTTNPNPCGGRILLSARQSLLSKPVSPLIKGDYDYSTFSFVKLSKPPLPGVKHCHLLPNLVSGMEFYSGT